MPDALSTGVHGDGVCCVFSFVLGVVLGMTHGVSDAFGVVFWYLLVYIILLMTNGKRNLNQQI